MSSEAALLLSGVQGDAWICLMAYAAVATCAGGALMASAVRLIAELVGHARARAAASAKTAWPLPSESGKYVRAPEMANRPVADAVLGLGETRVQGAGGVDALLASRD